MHDHSFNVSLDYPDDEGIRFAPLYFFISRQGAFPYPCYSVNM